MLSDNQKGPIYIAMASICWSFGGVLIKFIPWGAMSIVGIRALLAAAVFVIYRRSVKLEFTPGNILTAICLSSTTVMYVFANQLTTAAAAILLQFTSPVFIMLIYLLFYRKKPTISAVVAVFFTFIGMLLFFVENLDAGSFWGNILALISGLSMAGVYVGNKRPDTNPETRAKILPQKLPASKFSTKNNNIPINVKNTATTALNVGFFL